MKKFTLKLVCFLFPLIVLLGMELFALPIDFFTFRVWEAIVVRKYRNFFPGHFYPNMEITKVEEGDLAPHTRFAVKKNVRWMTDQHGYRKTNAGLQRHNIVIIGESNIAGSGLTQEEILSEVLESRLGVYVYPYAPVGGISAFLKDIRFLDHPPEIVIFARIERELLDLDLLKPVSRPKWIAKLKRQIQMNPVVQSLGMHLDRFSKMVMLHSVRASIRRILSPPELLDTPPVPSAHGPLFFIQGKAANETVPQTTLDKAIQIIKQYQNVIEGRGHRFIFLPIPNKENIFYESLRTPKPTFLTRLIEGLRREGVEVIDTQRAFDEAYQQRRVLLYQTDDTHWNAEGVRIAADLLANLIERGEHPPSFQ